MGLVTSHTQPCDSPPWWLWPPPESGSGSAEVHVPTCVGMGPDDAAVCLKPHRRRCRTDGSVVMGTSHMVSPGGCRATPAQGSGPSQPQAPRQVGLAAAPAPEQP